MVVKLGLVCLMEEELLLVMPIIMRNHRLLFVKLPPKYL